VSKSFIFHGYVGPVMENIIVTSELIVWTFKVKVQEWVFMCTSGLFVDNFSRE
jgi:hypothetical protein